MRKQMPHNVSKRIAFLTNKLELTYGDYAEYTEVLDELHTFIINEAQEFKPRRIYKSKED